MDSPRLPKASAQNSRTRVLAYYLPQFHRTKENDQWHGEGFTEWTKVRAATPLFEGHRQPRVPHPDIGYYTLEDSVTLKKQAAMMDQFGISGMIFYHYRFGAGKKLLEKPAELLLDHPEINMPFCFAWCNENWTKRWDGGNNSVLMEQKYSAQDAIEFAEEFVNYARDERYIKIMNRPLLIIYRPHLIPDIALYINVWKEVFADSGLPFPFLVASHTWGNGSENQFIQFFDAVSEKPLYDYPDLAYLSKGISGKGMGGHSGLILSYCDVVDHYISQPKRSPTLVIPSLSPGWDVSPRHKGNALILLDNTAKDFERWFRDCMVRINRWPVSDQRLIFINAWNEWAEGAYLEPDTEMGYQFLESVRKVLGEFRQ
jgi:lipopolysaccharide biosynthesis protein